MYFCRCYNAAMTKITNDELLKRAAAIIKPKKYKDYIVADVGCALVTDRGNVYVGVCVDTYSGMGFCAEYSAIAAMITAGEYKIEKLVAVWKNENGMIQILPPCGRCREFIRAIDEGNLETDILLQDKVMKLKELLPYHNWFENNQQTS
jgi:cytidine deaminase